MTTHLLRPSALTLAASLALIGISSAGAAAIDKQTETAIPRTGNL